MFSHNFTRLACHLHDGVQDTKHKIGYQVVQQKTREKTSTNIWRGILRNIPTARTRMYLDIITPLGVEVAGPRRSTNSIGGKQLHARVGGKGGAHGPTNTNPRIFENYGNVCIIWGPYVTTHESQQSMGFLKQSPRLSCLPAILLITPPVPPHVHFVLRPCGPCWHPNRTTA